MRLLLQVGVSLAIWVAALPLGLAEELPEEVPSRAVEVWAIRELVGSTRFRFVLLVAVDIRESVDAILVGVSDVAMEATTLETVQ